MDPGMKRYEEGSPVRVSLTEDASNEGSSWFVISAWSSASLYSFIVFNDSCTIIVQIFRKTCNVTCARFFDRKKGRKLRFNIVLVIIYSRYTIRQRERTQSKKRKNGRFPASNLGKCCIRIWLDTDLSYRLSITRTVFRGQSDGVIWNSKPHVLEDSCPKSKAIPYGAGETYRWSRSHIPNQPGSVYSFIHSTSAKSVYSNLIARSNPSLPLLHVLLSLSPPPIALSSRFQAPFKFAQAQFAKTTMPLTRVHSTLLIWLPREQWIEGECCLRRFDRTHASETRTLSQSIDITVTSFKLICEKYRTKLIIEYLPCFVLDQLKILSKIEEKNFDRLPLLRTIQTIEDPREDCYIYSLV